MLVTSDMKPVINMLGNLCKTFNNYDELASLLKYYKDDMDSALEEGLRTMKFAKEKLIWEKFEENIIKSYKIANLMK